MLSERELGCFHRDQIDLNAWLNEVINCGQRSEIVRGSETFNSQIHI